MLTVAFYSFRGGVGRTMALVNTAYQMAKAGLRVAVVDFDLEAPGLTLMEELRPSNPRSPIDKRGLMGYLLAGMKDPAKVPKVGDLVYRAWISDTKELRESKGAIYVLPAGDLKESAQGYDVSQLDFATLFEDKAHLKVIDDLKPGIEQKTGADYLLVDSRTGLTEIGGVCMAHLADHIVVLTGLNDQNIQGTAMVLERLAEAREGIGDRMIFVASPVPMGEEELKEKRLSIARRCFASAIGVKAGQVGNFIQIPYHPFMGLSEEIFFAKFPGTAVSLSYRSLSDNIRVLNQQDMKYIVGRASRLAKSNPIESVKLVIQCIENVQIDNSLKIEILFIVFAATVSMRIQNRDAKTIIPYAQQLISGAGDDDSNASSTDLSRAFRERLDKIIEDKDVSTPDEAIQKALLFVKDALFGSSTPDS